MIFGVLWRKNEDERKVDGESLQGDVVVMDKERLQVHHARGSSNTSGLLATCLGCESILTGTARQAHTGNCRDRKPRRRKPWGSITQHSDRGAENRTRTTSAPEGGGHEQAALSELMDRDGENAPNQSSSASRRAGTEVNNRKRNAETEDTERVHEKLSTSEGTKRERLQ